MADILFLKSKIKGEWNMGKEPEKALVLFSGGQDSTTCLYWAINKFGKENVKTLNIDYKQRHVIETKCAQKIAIEIAKVSYQKFQTTIFQDIGDSALMQTGNISAEHRGSTNLPASFVPGRNILFLTIAAALAYKHGITNIVTGVCQTDYSGYYDCRQSFIDSMQDVIDLGIYGNEMGAEWLRGFIEGEGSFSRSKHKSGSIYPTFSIQQSELEILKKIQKYFGIGWITKRKLYPNGLAKKQSWEFRLANQGCIYIKNLMQNNFRTKDKEEKFKKWCNDHKKYFKKNVHKEVRKNNFKIYTPLMYLTKANTIELAKSMPGCMQALAYSHTCYEGKSPPCRKCPACKLRAKGFKEVGIEDPLITRLKGEICQN